jgi:hypothetical protein
MPTLGTHFADEIVPTIMAAAKASEQEAVGPYIREAVMQRLTRDGMMPGNDRAELNAVIEDMGAAKLLALAKAELQREAAEKADRKKGSRK